MAGMGGKREGAGRKPHVPTPETRKFVEERTGMGAPAPRIAYKLGISFASLTKHYREELDNGVEEANRCVAGVLFKKATSPEVNPSTVSAAIFWLKTRDNWSERDTLDVTLQTVTDKPLTALEWTRKHATFPALPAPSEDAAFTEILPPSQPTTEGSLPSHDADLAAVPE